MAERRIPGCISLETHKGEERGGGERRFDSLLKLARQRERVGLDIHKSSSSNNGLEKKYGFIEEAKQLLTSDNKVGAATAPPVKIQ